ncbi:MAG: hypothetical protein JRI96_07405 [Deltaproteobacteria bacterium]|nr:hypothetical protein [Deltaproteobacteria bacterium]
MDLSKHKIIFVHGLASKPPADDLLARWRLCLIENIRCYDAKLADEMEENKDDLFHMAYWANVIPNHIEDARGTWKAPVEALMKIRKEKGDNFHVSNKVAKFNNFWKSMGLDAVSIVTNVLTVKDDVAKKLLLEVKLYTEDCYIADKIRQIVEDPLRKAIREKRKIALICHSMGTFVSYDVLWRFSHHRSCDDMWKKRVKLFLTMGSPLGDNMIQAIMLGKRYGYDQEKGLLKNVDYWVNLSALGDIVSHDQTLEDDFKKTKQLKLLKGFRDYRGLYNPYKNAEGKANPHSSAGYLLQPKLAKTMFRFFGKEKW